jgi:hypothetical protein
MNFKTTYLLFGILGALLLVFGLTQLAGLRKPDQRSAFVLPSLNDAKNPIKPEDVEAVEVERTRPTAEKLVFYRTEQGWKLKQPEVRVEGYLVDRIIDQVKGARIEEKADVTDNPKQFGLDTPAATVTLTKKGGDKEYKLHLGNQSPDVEKGVVYVTSSDRKAPAAVRRSELDALFKEVNDFRSKDLLTASSINTQAVTLQPAGKDPLALDKSGDKWKFVRPAYGEAETDSTPAPTTPGAERLPIAAMQDLLNALSGIRVEDVGDFVAADVSDAELAEKYGLASDKPATLRIEAKRTGGGLLGGDEKKEPVTEVLLVVKKVEDKKDDVKPAGKADKYYARLDGERAVVAIPAKSVEPLLKVAQTPDVLRNRDLLQVETAKVDALNIQNAAGLVKLRRVGQPETWKLYAGGPQRAADDRAVADLLAALTAKRIVKTFPDKTDGELGLDKPVAEVALWTDGLQKEEKKDDKPEEKKDDKKDAKAGDKKDEKKDAKLEKKKPADAEPKLKDDKPRVRLFFGKQDGDVVYVRRESGDDKVRMAVPASLLAKVTDGALAYLDRTLPAWPVDAEPVKVTLTRGSDTYEIEREKKDDKAPPTWRVKQPAPAAGRLADARAIEDIVGDLRTLATDRLVAEKPSDADLEKFGLKTPAFRAATTLQLKDKKTEERTLLIGKELDDKSGRYAKLANGDLVFVVRPPVVAGLQGELLDPTVLTFDPAKVKGMKLVGWQAVLGAPWTFDLERKGPGQWAAKQPPGYPLNQSQAENFLNSLNNLRALKFVVNKGGPKPEHKLDVKDGALAVELTLDGEKEPVKLTLGAHSGADKAYFAATSKLPGDVFLLPEDRFKKVLESPAFFK